MPYKSEAQRRYFNANRKKLEAEGVDVDHWNETSKGKDMPEKKAYADAVEKQARSGDLTYPLVGLGLGGALGAAGHYWDKKKLRDLIQEQDDPDIRKYLKSEEKGEKGDLMNRILFPATLGGLAGIGVKAFAERNKYGSCIESNLDKQANYSVIQNMAWIAAQQDSNEKTAGIGSVLLRGLNLAKPVARHELAQTGYGAAAGAATSPFTRDLSGIDTGAGRAGHLASSIAVGASLGNPSVRKSLFSRKPWGRAGQAKAEQAALKSFSKANPSIKSTEDLLNAFNKSTGGKPQRISAPVKGTLLASSLASAPTAIGSYMDPTKRFADKLNAAIEGSDAGEDFKSPSQFFARVGSSMAKEYGFDKEWVENVGKNIGINAGASLMGGGLGGLLGGKLADAFSSVAIDEGQADYKNLDEAAYKKRRRQQKLKNLLWWAGHIGGGVAGASLGAKYLPDKLRAMFPKKANDTNSEIAKMARLAAEKQAGIGMNPEAKRRLLGGLAGGGIGAGLGAGGNLILDPLMDKLFKSPEEQMREKARTTLAERMKARLIAGAAVGGGIGVARGSGMKDLFKRT